MREARSPRAARIELLCIGSELLSGHVNTHQGYLALALKSRGLSLARESSLPDDAGAIRREVRSALGRSDVILLCGGLGPTFDDVTREAVASALGRRLRYRPRLYGIIKKKFARYRLPVPEENKRQAWVIAGARVLPNKTGSAPGQMIVRRSPRGPQTIVLLPGPFSELGPMVEKMVLPALRKTWARLHAEHLCVHLSGIPESLADEKLKGLTSRPGPGESFTILASAGEVDFHATAAAPTAARARARIRKLREKIYAAVGGHVFGEGPETLESAVGKRLRARGLTLAVAESCTAGMLGERLTAVPGSSDYFQGGAIAYSNALKTRLLGVRKETLARHGAVSARCAREMAEGARRLAGSSLGLSITGIAGPGGGTKLKPVGLVFIALAGQRGSPETMELRLSGSRQVIRQRAAAAALHFLLRRLD